MSIEDLDIQQLCIVKTILSIIGLMGNTIVITVILCGKSMRTATNYCLLSVAISDVMILVCSLFFDLRVLTESYDFPTESFVVLKDLAMYSSILTLTVFACERYIAIHYPLRTYSTDRVSGTLKILLQMWLISFSAVAAKEIIIKLNSLGYFGTETYQILDLFYQGTIFTLFLFVPGLVTLTAYALIVLELKKRNRERKQNLNAVSENEQKIHLMILFMVAIIIITWPPVFIVHFKTTYRRIFDKSFHGVSYAEFSFSYLMLQLSPLLNPLIYSALSTNFQAGFKEVIIDRFFCGNPSVQPTARDRRSDDSEKERENAPENAAGCTE